MAAAEPPKRTRLQYGAGQAERSDPAAAPAEESPKGTRLQYGEEGAERSDPHASQEPGLVRRCATCGTRFSGDAQFCPFDGERLHTGRFEAPQDPVLGTTVDGRYEVERVLGEGGMGTVYRVRHVSLDRRFAMKVLRADLSREPELGARFTREARAAATIAHVNIVQITDFGVLPSRQPYFVMELLEGSSLSALMRRGPLSRSRALQIMTQVARGLDAAHQGGIIHRDLKPDNVVVIERPHGDLVKVVDFGLARVAGQSRLTKGGMVFGTPHYMSPEQARGDELDARSDQYSLGVLMYEAFTGRVPFEADTYMGVMTQHVYAEPAPPAAIAKDGRVTPEIERVILRCLDKDPERRFASMAELATKLDALRAPLSSSPRAAPAGRHEELATRAAGEAPFTGTERWSRWLLLGVGIALAGSFTGVIGWLLWPRTPEVDKPALHQPKVEPVSAQGSVAPPVPLPGAVTHPSTPAPAQRPPAVAALGKTTRSSAPPAAPSVAREEAPPPKAPSPSPQPRFRSGEIVDPWSQ